MMIPLMVWFAVVVVLALVVGVVVERSERLPVARVRSRARARRLWVGVGVCAAGLDRVRSARSDAGAGGERPITSGVRCSAWRGRPHAHACNRLFEEMHRLDRLNRPIGSETRMKNIGLTRQQEEEMR